MASVPLLHRHVTPRRGTATLILSSTSTSTQHFIKMLKSTSTFNSQHSTFIKLHHQKTFFLSHTFVADVCYTCISMGIYRLSSLILRGANPI